MLQHEIAILKQDVETYKSRCTQLEDEAKNVKDLELKVKCLQMWCDDDEVIDELMTAVKEKEESEKTYSVNTALGYGAASQAAQTGLHQQRMGLAGGRGMANASGLGNIFGGQF